MHILDIPELPLENVLNFLSLQQIGSVRLVCKRFRSIADRFLSKNLCDFFCAFVSTNDPWDRSCSYSVPDIVKREIILKKFREKFRGKRNFFLVFRGPDLYVAFKSFFDDHMKGVAKFAFTIATSDGSLVYPLPNPHKCPSIDLYINWTNHNVASFFSKNVAWSNEFHKCLNGSVTGLYLNRYFTEFNVSINDWSNHNFKASLHSTDKAKCVLYFICGPLTYIDWDCEESFCISFKKKNAKTVKRFKRFVSALDSQIPVCGGHASRVHYRSTDKAQTDSFPDLVSITFNGNNVAAANLKFNCQEDINSPEKIVQKINDFKLSLEFDIDSTNKCGHTIGFAFSFIEERELCYSCSCTEQIWTSEALSYVEQLFPKIPFVGTELLRDYILSTVNEPVYHESHIILVHFKKDPESFFMQHRS